MIIRKLFKFEGAHIVRNCYSERCSKSIHGHSYKVEVFLEAMKLDHAQMVLDFGVMKGPVAKLIDAFDHTMLVWDKDRTDYVQSVICHSDRYIVLPFNPSAEMLALFFLKAITIILRNTALVNGEGDVTVIAVRVHETDTGYAEASIHDLQNTPIDLVLVEFSEACLKGDMSYVESMIKDGGFDDTLSKPPHQV